MAASWVIYQQPNGTWAFIATDLVAGVHTIVTSPASGSTSLFADGTVAAPSIAFQSEPGLGVYRVGAAVMGFASLGANVATNTGVASAVNYIDTFNTITAFPPGIRSAGSDANIPLVLQPKGTGGLQAQQYDGTTTGGNARGANAVDFQTIRSVNTMVASAQYSAVLSGQNNTASATGAVVCGGTNNIASGVNAFVGGGGNSNVASGQASVVSGGVSNTASGLFSWTPGGNAGTTRGNYGRGAWASGALAAVGDAQAGEFVLRRITTDATVTNLTADNAAVGAANTVNLPNNSGYALKLLVRAYQTVGATVGDGATFECTVQFTRITNAAGTTFDGGYYIAPTTFLPTAIVAGTGFAPCFAKGGGTAWRLTVSADTTNGAPSFTITGEASKTIRTVARVLSVEVTA